MSRTCSICNRDDRAAIDEALVGGRKSLAHLASRFDSTKPTMARHRKHLAGKIAAAQAVNRAALVVEGTTLADQLRWIISEAVRLKAAAEMAKDYRTALHGLREIVRVLELVAEIERAARDTPAASFQTEWSSLAPEERRTRLAEVKYRILELEADLASS
jgi:hypothetical protein